MIVQIYEVTTPTEAKALAKLSVDHVGVLVGKGEYPREVSYKQAHKIFRALPKEAKAVALTLSSNLTEIARLVEEVKPDILHLGALPEDLSPADATTLKRQFPHLKVMRAIPVLDGKSVALAKTYECVADFLLLDTYSQQTGLVGATGKTHNWEISKKIVDAVKVPVILAGGLGPENVAEAIRKVKPAGVDSKTKTDISGTHRKDLQKVKQFVEIAKL